ncbi:DUF1735 domain-containing protein [Wenyingzhuangia marina]|uniref:BT-3987-like N-terminal domain-containing protein n=1 Tax=Wenyingzhuangia marina TaxID=1195760 RepID=A0A1M5V368_9FLAO|nr:DUF1735 domain-containing protein [Wenyingzhuangia marina]GGF74730.1 hypothetical protein GCM10011397_17070 [Wenyingzhuangia marina]SHH69702.1 protein of unknown function [Wenyingzhuangia marina]
MKKILIFSIIISVLTSCYDEFRLDNEFSAVAFSNVTGGSNEQGVLWRTVVKDEGLKLNAGVYLAGILDNEKERWVDFELDPALLSGTDYTLLPSDYYTLSNNSRFIIPSGKSIGTVEVLLDSIKFLNDPLAIKANYAIPFKLTETSEDSILSTQNTQILVLKYINRQEGYYNQKANYATINNAGDTLNTGSVENLLMASTLAYNSVQTNGTINIGDYYNMKYVVNDNNEVSVEYVPNLDPIEIRNVALESKVIAAKVSDWEVADAIKDDYQPTSSEDKNGAAFGNWPNPNAWDFVEYEFPSTYSITNSNVYWWTDLGGIQIPYNTYLEYWDLDSEEWKLISGSIVVNGVSIPDDQYGLTTYDENNKAPGTDADMYNETFFDPITTNKVRIHFISIESQGILEWQVWGLPASSSLETASYKTIISNGVSNYDPAKSSFDLKYRIYYKDQNDVVLDYYTDVYSNIKWRNRIRDGVNEWRR